MILKKKNKNYGLLIGLAALTFIGALFFVVKRRGLITSKTTDKNFESSQKSEVETLVGERELPSNFPSDFPLYPGAEIEESFTTKGDDEGTGMGLSAAYGIIRNHGGTITVDSKPGKGTIFNVFLPVLEEAEEEQDLETFETLPKGKERILVIDDEKSILDMLKKTLELLGYKIEVFQGPVEILAD